MLNTIKHTKFQLDIIMNKFVLQPSKWGVNKGF